MHHSNAAQPTRIRTRPYYAACDPTLATSRSANQPVDERRQARARGRKGKPPRRGPPPISAIGMSPLRSSACQGIERWMRSFAAAELEFVRGFPARAPPFSRGPPNDELSGSVARAFGAEETRVDALVASRFVLFETGR